MAKKELWKGNEAMAEAAIKAGCDAYFGYPITPQSEIPEYMSKRMPEVGRVFLQTESEVATINMLYGAGGTGKRVMSSSSSLGVSLMQEGISYLVGAEVPCVLMNCMRGGPGLGTIQPGQADYYQMVKGGASGDHPCVVLAPANMQEAVDFIQEAFDIADQYRNPCFVLVDGLIGQMMEPIEWREVPKRDLPSKEEWAACGRHGAEKHHVIKTIFAEPEDDEVFNEYLEKKAQLMKANEVRYEEVNCDDAEVVIVAYGTPARISLSVVRQLRAQGVKVGLFRPQVLWPYPEEALHELAMKDNVKHILCVEMSRGQMLDDVKMSVAGAKPVAFFGRTGGMIPTVEEISEKVMELIEEGK